MAKSTAVWGIDIGRCALKALRCRLDGDAVVADGFDYIEYPKLLTQPDADAPQLVKEALEQFLSRNSLKGDKVAICVSGESGLARYFKPPPVDVKKIADIVKYEAKQQIPFALEDVIWDYQRLAGGQEVDGFALDTEIGLFAMKREQVAKALTPYNVANIEVDIIQLAPIAIYNYIGYDVAKGLKDGEEYNSEAPPPSTVVLSIGTDTTDLVVTNGFRVWQRNIPLGGNHFTRQLSKDLKLTFAKAEHLKRNPKQAEDPKAVFQAMRPVFADLVTEMQRSIGFFQSLDRKAKIEKVVMLGNTVKLPGLVQYLGKHLGYPIQEIESFGKLSGAAVVTSPSFKDNLLAFGACYGLCLQGLGKGKLSTNLLPREIVVQRMIKAKKPWAVAGVGLLTLACALNFVFFSVALNQVHEDREIGGYKWKEAQTKAKSVSMMSNQLKSADDKQKADLKFLRSIGQEVVGASDRRVLWSEVMLAINSSLPPMAEKQPSGVIPDPQQLPFIQRRDLKIEYIESQYFPDLQFWFNDTVKTKWLELNKDVVAAAMAPPADPSNPNPTPPATDPNAAPAAPLVDANGQPIVGSGTDVSMINIPGAPTGPGWVIEIKGHHYYNPPGPNAGPAHVRDTLIRNLEHGSIDLPLGPNQPIERFTFKELGIGFAFLAENPPIKPKFPIPNPNYVAPATQGQPGFGGPMAPAGGPVAAPADPNNPEYFYVPRYDFKVQFCWIEKPINVRLEEREAKRRAAEEAAKNNPQPAVDPAAGPGPAVPGPAVPPAAPNGVPPAQAVPPAAPIPQPQPQPMPQPMPVPPPAVPEPAPMPMPAAPAVPPIPAVPM
ncbi:MAG: pilus assembly protein PilM [Pirellulaceae bacterium]|nr:pilus assembly protein PilM [Pirellulaceae bacterium]